MLIYIDVVFSLAAVLGLFLAAYYVGSIRGTLISGIAMLSLGASAFPWNRLPISGAAITALLGLCLFTLAYSFSKRGALPIVINSYTKALFAVVAVVIVWVVFSDYALSYGGTKAGLFVVKGVIPALAFLSLGAYSRREFHVLVAAIIFCSVMLGLRYGLSDAAEVVRTRFAVDFSPITIGRIIGAGIPLCLAISLFSRRVPSLVFFGLACMLGYALLLPGSRGAVLAVAVGVVMTTCLALLWSPRLNKGLLLLKVAAVGGIVVMLAGFYITFAEESGLGGAVRIYDFYGDFQVEETLEEARFTLLRLAWEGFVATSGLGMGTGGYSVFAPVGVDRIDGYYPHNLFAEFLAEQGVVGLVVIVWLTGVAFRRILFVMSRPWTGSFTPALCAFWVFSLVISMFSANIADNYHFWIGGAFLFIPGLIDKQKREGPRDATRRISGELPQEICRHPAETARGGVKMEVRCNRMRH